MPIRASTRPELCTSQVPAGGRPTAGKRAPWPRPRRDPAGGGCAVRGSWRSSPTGGCSWLAGGSGGCAGCGCRGWPMRRPGRRITAGWPWRSPGRVRRASRGCRARSGCGWWARPAGRSVGSPLGPGRLPALTGHRGPAGWQWWPTGVVSSRRAGSPRRTGCMRPRRSRWRGGGGSWPAAITSAGLPGRRMAGGSPRASTPRGSSTGWAGWSCSARPAVRPGS